MRRKSSITLQLDIFSHTNVKPLMCGAYCTGRKFISNKLCA